MRLRRYFGIDRPFDDADGFQLFKSFGQHPVVQERNQLRDFGKVVLSEQDRPDDQAGPAFPQQGKGRLKFRTHFHVYHRPPSFQ